MAYCTRYTLIVDDFSLYSEIEKDVDSTEYWGGYGRFHLAEMTDTISWYNHRKDLHVISKKYPHVLFILDGEGEESGDIWRMYFKNGKSYKDEVEIKFPPLDESKLK